MQFWIIIICMILQLMMSQRFIVSSLVQPVVRVSYNNHHPSSVIRINRQYTTRHIKSASNIQLFISNNQQQQYRSYGYTRTNNRSRSKLASTTTSSSNNDIEDGTINKKVNAAAAKEKRKQLMGLAKAVDRGQYAVTYAPGGTIRGQSNFIARSGLPDRTKLFTVLGIESSCDDTGAAIVRSDGIILGEALASQHTIHEEWGGVVPGLARDAHVAQINIVIEQALKNACMTSINEVDAIGVTVGPGLEICLRVGTTKAIELAQQYNKPFVGIHHLEAHILMARLPYNTTNTDSLVYTPATDTVHELYRSMEFPFLALLVSGGHCQVLQCYGVGDYTILGGTLDDSLGEAYDKTARLLGLPVGGGGGPAIEKLAQSGNPKAIRFSVPMQTRKDYDFSFAGLKTNVRRITEQYCIEHNVENASELPEQVKANIAASFQYVAITHIEQRLKRAMMYVEQNYGVRTLAVVGGVAANQELRKRLESICTDRSWMMHVPPPRLCTDQGAMSAWAAIERIMVGSTDDPSNQQVYARFPFAVMEDSSSTSETQTHSG